VQSCRACIVLAEQIRVVTAADPDALLLGLAAELAHRRLGPTARGSRRSDRTRGGPLGDERRVRDPLPTVRARRSTDRLEAGARVAGTPGTGARSRVVGSVRTAASPRRAVWRSAVPRCRIHFRSVSERKSTEVLDNRNKSVLRAAAHDPSRQTRCPRGRRSADLSHSERMITGGLINRPARDARFRQRYGTCGSVRRLRG